MKGIAHLRRRASARFALALLVASALFASCGESNPNEDGDDDGLGGRCTSKLDCAEGETCVSNTCRPSCDSDDDCTALRLRCDRAAGACVRCVENADCTEGSSCRAGACRPDTGDGGASAGGMSGEGGVGAMSGDGGGGASSGDGGSAGDDATGGSGASAGAGAVGGTGGGGGVSGSGAGTGGGSGAGQGGSAGSTGGAGNGGTGGSGPTGCANEAFIDDMEDGDSVICVQPNRQGSWYVAKKPAVGTVTPASSPFAAFLFTDRTGYGVRFTGSGFSGTGNWAVIGAKMSTLGPFDATRYTGIRFWAKGSSSLMILVNLPTVASAGSANGGTCIPQAGLLCDNHWGATKQFTTAWSQFEIRFASGISRHGDTWGVASAKDMAHLLAVEFVFHTMYNAVGSFTFYVDDVTFY